MLSSVYGEILEILLVFPGIYTSASATEYSCIVETFSPKGKVHTFLLEDPKFRLEIKSAFNPRSGDQVPSAMGRTRSIHKIPAIIDPAQMLQRWKDELEQLRSGGQLTYQRWAQDPFVTMVGHEAIVLLQSYHSQRLVDFLLPLQVAEQAGQSFLLKPTRLALAGGNMLCTRTEAFIGRDLILKNERLLNLSEAQVIALFEQVLGMRKVNVIGMAKQRPRWPTDPKLKGTWQPLFHIDLFLTLGGSDDLQAREIVFLANESLSNTILSAAKADGLQVRRSQCKADMQERLVEARAAFSDSQYMVVDLPIFFMNGTCYSWNNALVEVAGQQRRVYVPSYQSTQDEQGLNPTFELLEAKVAEQYASAGFQVQWIRCGRFFRLIASHGGSLHCVTKVLRRAAS